MSSYLTFYLVPKKTKKKYVFDKDKKTDTEVEVKISEGEPLDLMSFCRSNEVYQAYKETLNPAYCGYEMKYTEITVEDTKKVIEEYEKDVKSTEQRLEIDYKMLKEGGFSGDIWDDIQSMENHLREQKDTIRQLEDISNLVDEVYNGFGDFEKVLINVD